MHLLNVYIFIFWTIRCNFKEIQTSIRVMGLNQRITWKWRFSFKQTIDSNLSLRCLQYISTFITLNQVIAFFILYFLLLSFYFSLLIKSLLVTHIYIPFVRFIRFTSHLFKTFEDYLKKRKYFNPQPAYFNPFATEQCNAEVPSAVKTQHTTRI